MDPPTNEFRNIVNLRKWSRRRNALIKSKCAISYWPWLRTMAAAILMVHASFVIVFASFWTTAYKSMLSRRYRLRKKKWHLGVHNYFRNFIKNAKEWYRPADNGFGFSPVLCIGTTFTFFNKSENIPDFNYLLRLFASVGSECSVYVLTSEPARRSRPTDIKAPNFFIARVTSDVVTPMNERSFPVSPWKYQDLLFSESLLTNANCLENITFFSGSAANYHYV